MKTLIVIVLISSVIYDSTQLNAQSSFRFRHYDTKDGLASETAEAILQDSLGFIWIQYYGGVSRFDGYTFKTYQYNPDEPVKSIGSGVMTTMFKDYSGNIWLYFWKGGKGENPKRYFLKYDRSKETFIEYLIDFKTPGFNISFDRSDSIIWLAGGDGSGLFKFNYRRNESQAIFHTAADSIESFNLNSLRGVADMGPYLILGSNKGLWKYDKKANKFSRPDCNPKDSSFLYNSGILVRQEISSYDSGIWCQAKGRIIHMDKNLAIKREFKIPKAILEAGAHYDASKNGDLWVATNNNGLFRFHSRSDSVENMIYQYGDPYSLHSNWLTGVMVDRDQNIWVTTREKGISVLKKQDIQFSNYKIGGFGSTTVYEANGQDYIMVARTDKWPPNQESVNEFLISPVPKYGLSSLKFESIKLARPVKGEVYYMNKGKTNFWLTTSAGELLGLPLDDLTGRTLPGPISTFSNDPKNPNTISNPSTVTEDENGNLWIGTWGEGLLKINSQVRYGAEGSIEKFQYTLNDSTSISNNMVLDIIPHTAESFWVSTWSGIDHFENGRFDGVFKSGVPITAYRAKNGTTYIGTADGLYVNKAGEKKDHFIKDKIIKGAVHKIQEDGFGRLWLSNLMKIICYSPDEEIALSFDESDGIDHTHGIIETTSYGAFLTANIEGISIFDPLSLQINRVKTFPVLTKLLINNKEPNLFPSTADDDSFSILKDISMIDELVIDYWHNNFTVEYSSMQMTAPEKNLYRHKLEGYDNDWIETDYKNRTATYTNLPSGTYTFRVKASNHHGVWSDQERTLKVIILPPPWRTWWAYSGYGLLVAGLLVWARRNIVQRERLKASLQLEHVEREKEHFELEKAKEVDRVKTSFFTNISHEFRTPLTLIKGPVQDLLEKFSNDVKVQEKLKLVQRNSDLLLKLINQLLDLAKLESGSLKVEKTEGDVFSFVRAIASSFESFARQKNVSLLVNVPEGSCHALFDKDKVETILINLINNAVKFTSAGGMVSVSVDLTPHPPLQRRGGASAIDTGVNKENSQSKLTPLSFGEGPGVRLIVRDTGIGIPPDQQQKIFERFHQVSEAHKEVGTGIGLALVKELVALMGGEISVVSEVGKGSEFRVSLPLELASGLKPLITGFEEKSLEVESLLNIHESASSQRPEASGQDAEARPQVLVVEDNTDLRHFIIDSLGDEFHFLEAENGVQGLDTATKEIPDLIISDVMMPEMDGITMAGKIKKDIRTSHIPLILLTAKSSEDSKLSGLSSGADDYLTKPFNRNELLLKVRNGVNRQLKLREKLRAELLSTALKVEVLSEDEKFLQQVKEKILERLSDEQLSVESLAEDIGMSRVHLYRKVSGLAGISVNELIRKLRLQRAAQLLQQKWGPVSQVAYEVGFSNLSYFSKVFKEEFGVLPSEYAEKI